MKAQVMPTRVPRRWGLCVCGKGVGNEGSVQERSVQGVDHLI